MSSDAPSASTSTVVQSSTAVQGTSTDGLQDAALALETWALDTTGSSRLRKRGSEAVAVNYKESAAPRTSRKRARHGTQTNPTSHPSDNSTDGEWTGLPVATKFKTLPHINTPLNTKLADAEMQVWDIQGDFQPAKFLPIWKDRILLSLPTYELYSDEDGSRPQLVRVTRVFEWPSLIGSQDYNIVMKIARLSLANRSFQEATDPDFEIRDDSPVASSIRVLPQNHGLSDDQLRNIFRTHSILEVGESSGQRLGPDALYSFIHRDLRAPAHVHSAYFIQTPPLEKFY